MLAPSLQRRPAGGAHGFTLLELMIVIAIVVGLAVAVVPAIEGVMGVKTREEAGKIAGSIRAMYGESALSGRTCRLVFDLEESKWWPECAKGRVRVARQEESARGARIEEEEDDDDFALTDEEKAARARVEARNQFNAYAAPLVSPRELPDGTTFEGIWTQHQTEVYTSGQAYLYFFPHGQTERAYLYLGNGTDVYTVIVDPMTGRTKVKAEKVDVPERDLSW